MSKMSMLTDELERLERRERFIAKEIAHQQLLQRNARIRKAELVKEIDELYRSGEDNK